MNYMDHMMRAMTCEGGRLKQAYLMGIASYHYTASFIGNTDPEHGEPVFTHWDAFIGGVECFWDTFKRSDAAQSRTEGEK